MKEEKDMSDSKKIKWTALAMMGFSTVWGFGNVLNGFIYFACHITYIASKGSGSLKALSWLVFRNAKTYDSFPTLYVQLASLAVFLIGCFIASRGLNPLKKLLSLAGTC